MVALRATALLCLFAIVAYADSEADYYALHNYPLPAELKLEASGLATLPDGRLAVAIRKGEVWILDNPTETAEEPEAYRWSRFASGLHEPLGLAWQDGALYTTQRSEVTRLEDSNADGVADAYLTAAKGWGVSGNYHEYAYGPVFDNAGNLWVTLNVTIGSIPKIPGRTDRSWPWRGWSMMQRPGGDLQPVSAGLRSPSGIGTNLAGDVFSTDQQGNWWGTCPLLHLKPGVFHGHADSLNDSKRPDSPVKHPGKLPAGITVAEAIDKLPGYMPPAVWFPYNKVGASTTGILCDRTAGKFGPFAGQLFVGEFTHAFVSRTFLEKVDGEYQGACFNFRRGMQTAVLQMASLKDGSMVVGQSNRGWNSIGTRSFGLARLVWTGKTPFEILKMEAQPDGFLLTFTAPVDSTLAAKPSGYAMKSYTYHYHKGYGSPEVNTKPVKIASAMVSEDGRSVKLTCDGLRSGYVHELDASGLSAADGRKLLHAQAYYTLNRIPKARR
ncbi:MAG: hypothetical protein ACI8W8_002334 [Rhodothermales bacterium]|jgi:hypothetical protein